MLNLVIRLYAALLRLYPRAFREKFADEMTQVFIEAIADAAKRGGLALMIVCWREIYNLPGMLWREHQLGRKEKQMNEELNVSDMAGDHLSWREIVIGLFPFTLGTILLLTSYPVPPPAWKSSTEWQVLTFAAYLVPVLFILGNGWAAKFPRWSYPYVGFVMYILIVVLSEPMRRLLMLSRDIWAQIFAVDIGLFLMFGCFVLVGYVWRPLRPLYEGVRRDWTQFSFGLYLVAAMFASVVDHDDYPTLTATVIMPSLILLLGALAYLNSTTKRQRILSMLIALSLSVMVRVIENKEFYPAIIAIIGIIAFLPVLLEFLPRMEKSPRVV